MHSHINLLILSAFGIGWTVRSCSRFRWKIRSFDLVTEFLLIFAPFNHASTSLGPQNIDASRISSWILCLHHNALSNNAVLSMLPTSCMAKRWRCAFIGGCCRRSQMRPNGGAAQFMSHHRQKLCLECFSVEFSGQANINPRPELIHSSSNCEKYRPEPGLLDDCADNSQSLTSISELIYIFCRSSLLVIQSAI